jgi:asparagine synthase (glutamine-hydrolysing)
MCGITGFVTTSADLARSLEADIRAAVRSLEHRGPDDEGAWIGPGAGLGHRRLSILDLSLASHQPMSSADGRYVIAYNGEVYNFADVRKKLEGEGHRFHTSGDTEVVVEAIAAWGVESAVRCFIGMFAIAIWDAAEKRLLLIRDRLGVKPLYYGWHGGTLSFGSELKALRAYRHWKPEIDRTALAEYFQFGYINAPRSIYRGVSKLPPGHWLELRHGQEPVVRRYWSVLDSIGEPMAAGEDELAEQLESLMVDAFRLRMVSDVPVGMFLSGGIDSSIVTAVLQRHHGGVHTFTIGFNEGKFDESPHARRVAAHLGTQHTERMLETSEATRILPRWADLYDEPFADSSGIPTYLVSKMAAEQVKVVLSADGGDELFSGYNSYTSMLTLLSKRERMPRFLRQTAQAALSLMPLDRLDELVLEGPIPAAAKSIARQQITRRARRARDYYLNEGTDGALYEIMVSAYWPQRYLPSLLGYSPPRVRELPDSYPGEFPEKMCLWDLHNFLSGDVLAKVDRATMAASIEGRDPLIDHRLVEFAFRLPLKMRRGALGPKHLLRKILYKYVPREIVDRPKMGFTIPLYEWLRGDLAHLVDEHLEPGAIRSQGLFDPATVEKAVKALRRGDRDAMNKVWSLVAFQMWRQRWG